MPEIGLVYHPDYLKHNSGPGHPESPDRLRAIMDELEANGLLARLMTIQPGAASTRWVEKIHSPQYIDYVRQMCWEGHRYLDSLDTGICPDSYDVALLAVGGALAASDMVMEGRIKRAFCALRPPGHHAERDRAMGFCLFNNIAIATRYLQEHHDIQKILIVDWDVHHGNGTQAAFYDDPTVFYFSIHQYPHYPGTGSRAERGMDNGLGFTLNVPVPPGSGDKDYISAFEKELLPQAEEFDPDFILISAGFDPHRDDPLSSINLSEEGFSKLTEMVIDLAEKTCEGRVISLLEGGYNLKALSNSVKEHIKALLNRG